MTSMAQVAAQPSVPLLDKVTSSPGNYSQLIMDSAGDSARVNNLIEDIVFNVWKCQNCLSMLHHTNSCTNQVRFRQCFRSGHRAKGCPGCAPSPTYRWVPRTNSVSPER